MNVEIRFYLNDNPVPAEVYRLSEDQCQVLQYKGTSQRLMKSSLMGQVAHLLDMVSGHLGGALTPSPDMVSVGFNSARSQYSKVELCRDGVVLDSMDRDDLKAFLDEMETVVAKNFEQWFKVGLEGKFDLLFPKEDG